MANIRWGINIAGAWSTGANWVGGVKPGAGDTAVFDGEFTGDVTAPAGVETIDALSVSPAYSGKMGTSGARLTVNCNGGSVSRLTYKGSGSEAWFTSTVDSAILDPQRMEASALNVSLTANGGKSWVAILGGRTNLIGGDIKNLFIARNGRGAVPEVSHDAACTLSGILQMNDGRVTLRGVPSDDIIVRGGILDFIGTASFSKDLFVTGGLVKATGANAVIIDSIRCMGGSIDFSAVSQIIAISSFLYVGHGAFVNLDNGVPVTLTGAVVLVEQGGSLIAPTLTVINL